MGDDLGAPDLHGAPFLVVGAGGHFIVGAEEGPGGVDGLRLIDVAVAGIGILGGGDDRPCGTAAGVGVGDADGSLHVGDCGRHVVAVLDGGVEGVHVVHITGEGDGLGVAVDDLDALVAKAVFHLVGGHAEADAHVEVAVGRVVGHVVGDAGTVYVGGVAAADAVVVSAVGAGLCLGILGSDAGGGGQAKVGAVGAGGVVSAGGIVGGAVGVEHDQAALGHGGADVVHGRVGSAVAHAAAAGGLIEGLPHGLVLGGVVVEGAVVVAGAALPVGLNQADVGDVGAAAADFRDGVEDGLGLLLSRRDLRGGGVVVGVVKLRFHAGVVAAGNSDGGFPHEEITVPLQGAGNVGLGGLDGRDDLGDGRDVVCFGHVVDAAAGLGSLNLDCFDLCKHVVVKNRVFFLRENVDRLVRIRFPRSLGEDRGGQKADDHHDRDQQGE